MFDMNQCKSGDKLISCHGWIFTYVGIDERFAPYRHMVKYSDGSDGSRVDDGSVYINNKLPTDHDIVGFAPDSVI